LLESIFNLLAHVISNSCARQKQHIRQPLRDSYRCIAYNARGYPPSDVPDDASLYLWQFAVDDIAAGCR
jgi:pimeloyl-ACP methyl ester carboxylesterase